MDKLSVLQQLKQVTGDLQAGTKTQGDALKKLERRLAEQIAQNSGFELSGTNLHASSTHIPAEATEHFSHLDDLFEEGERQSVAPALVFRRETSIRNNLLGNSVPEWGNGLAPSETSGPFFDKHGSEFYFDFFFGVHTVQVFISGLPYPVLLLPIRGLLIGRKNYQLTAGSVWIASNFIARKPELLGYYTGLKIKGGTLNFDVDATVTDGGLFSAPATKIALHLDLDQNVIGSASTEAGLDAANADVQLPQTVDFEFTLASSNGKQAMPAVLRSVAKRLFFFKMRPRNGNRCCNRFLFHTTCNRWSRRRINF